jgi:hypothetical protein
MGKSSAARVLTEVDPEPVEAEVPEIVAVVEEPPQRKSAYPEGTQLFSYTPKDPTSEIIELPLEFEKPDKVWLWEQNQQPYLSQTWNWLDRANVPKEVQRQCVSLPDEEYMEMFKVWFQAMGGGATPGE